MTIKKENKIMVIIAPTADDREQLMSRLAVRLGFAKVPSDGKKIIRKDIYSIDLSMHILYYAAITTFVVLSSRHRDYMSLQQKGFA